MIRERSDDSLLRSQFPLLWFNAFTYTLIASADRFTFNWLVDHELASSSPVQSGLVLFMLGLPVVLLSLPAGVLADRVDRRRLMMSTQVAGMAIAAVAALLVSSGRMTVFSASVVAFFFGSVVAVGQPVRSSVIQAVVGRGRLVRAVVAVTIAMNLGLIVGPLAVGSAIRWRGTSLGFWIQGALFAAGLVTIAFVRVPAHAKVGEPMSMATWRRDLADGLSYVRHHPGLRALLFLMAIGSAFMSSAASLLTPQIVDKVYGRDAADAAMLFGLMGVGMLATSVVLFRHPPRRRGLVFMLAMVTGTLNQTIQGFVDSYAALAVMWLLWGLSGGFYLNLSQVLLQTNAPPERMGRVVALGALVSSGLGPLGALAAGGVATVIGRQQALGLFGAVSLGCVLVCLVKAKGLRAL